MKLKIKDQIPDVKIFHLVDGAPKEQNISEVLGSKKIILFTRIRPLGTFLFIPCILVPRPPHKKTICIMPEEHEHLVCQY